MLIYRYFATHALESLRDHRLKVARISSFNDPFEGMYYAEGEMTRSAARAYVHSRLQSPVFIARLRGVYPQIRTDAEAVMYIRSNKGKMVQNLMNQFESIKKGTLAAREATHDKFLRVICFSSSEAKVLDEILMWSHYAGSHSGVRVGFEFPREIVYPFKIVPVTYQDNRIGINLTVDIDNSLAMQEAIKLSIKTKSAAWAYEKEYRLVTQPKHCTVEQGEGGTAMDFISFNKEWIKRVDFGARYPNASRSTFLDLLKSEYSHVQCNQAEYHKSEYALEYVKLV